MTISKACFDKAITNWDLLAGSPMGWQRMPLRMLTVGPCAIFFESGEEKIINERTLVSTSSKQLFNSYSSVWELVVSQCLVWYKTNFFKHCEPEVHSSFVQ
jgi:hypothetical protein